MSWVLFSAVFYTSTPFKKFLKFTAIPILGDIYGINQEGKSQKVTLYFKDFLFHLALYTLNLYCATRQHHLCVEEEKKMGALGKNRTKEGERKGKGEEQKRG